jgi:hypothetical protein
MATPKNADAKDLIVLAGRMGIPAGEAMRQVGQLIDAVAPELDVENADVLRTLCAAEVIPQS